MSLATQLLRWIVAFGVIAFACCALLFAYYQNLDRQRLLQVQASQILDLVFQHRAAQSVDNGGDRAASPWCLATKHFNAVTQSAYTVKDLSLHPRNPLNFPTDSEREQMATLIGQTFPQIFQGRVIIEGKEWFAAARPIHYSPVCLGCHSTIKTIIGKTEPGPPSGGSVLAATFVYLDPVFFSETSFLFINTTHVALGGWLSMVGLFLWLAVKRQVLQPLTASTRALKHHVAAQKRQPVLDIQVPDELEPWLRAINQLGADLQQAEFSLNAGMKELEEEENRFRALTQSAMDAIISANEEGLIVSWNRGAEKLFGYQEKEIIGKSVTLLIPAKKLPAHLNGYATAVASGVTRHRGEPLEIQGVHKNGHLLAVEISLTTWSISNQRQFSAIIRDIGKRKKNAEKNHRDFMSRVALNNILEVALKPLSLNEKLAKSLQVILAVPWLSLQYKGAIFLLNPKSGKLDMVVEHGLSEQLKERCQVISMGQCLCGLAASTQRLVFSAQVDASHTVQFEGMPPHGHYCVPILLDDRLLGVVNLYLQGGHLRDPEEIRFLETVAQTLAGIIDQKITERKLRYLSQAMEQSPVSVVITDTQGQIEYVNPTCCRVSGYESHELLGMNPRLLKSEEMPASIYKSLWDTILAGKVWRGELLNRKKNGELFWEDSSISPIRFENGEIRLFLAVKEDITQRKKLENDLAELLSTLDDRVMERTQELHAKIDELQQTRNELVKSEKMASLGRLVAGFAHEINTPIGVAVTGFSLVGEALRSMEKLLQQDEVKEEELHETMATVREASELALANITRAGKLVASFKRTSVNQSSDIHRLFHVRECIEDVIRSLHNKIKKTRVTTHVHVDPNLKILGWPGALEQILTNFIINSLTYGYRNDNPVGQIIISAKIKDRKMILNYSDDGVGMEESVRNLAFEPFFTTGRNLGGSGLGLYLCYNIVTSKLNGTISCESEPGQGVRFYISFPVQE
ncbi:MAG TPA: PAS domain S-box protein [Magnetococcales bacterium]|nr:PAS domain S-box protein [Magnetococcales bacterium]